MRIWIRIYNPAGHPTGDANRATISRHSNSLFNLSKQGDQPINESPSKCEQQSMNSSANRRHHLFLDVFPHRMQDQIFPMWVSNWALRNPAVVASKISREEREETK